MNNLLEENIFNNAIEGLKKNFDHSIDIQVQDEEKEIDNKKVDKLIKVKFHNKYYLFCVEIKNIFNKAQIGFLLQQKKELPYNLILISQYISPFIGDELKKKEIQFIDTAGNAYINCLPLYIHITGNKPPEILKAHKTKRVFKPSGLKIVYSLLCNPELIKKSYRDIAIEANVSLGTVGWIMYDLRQLGYVVNMGKRGKKLVLKKELLNKWCTEYPISLKPKIFIGRFQGPSDWWKEYKLDTNYALWGGEIAASKLTKYLKPQEITIYIMKNNLKNILLDNKLYRDDQGNIELYQCFWTKQQIDQFKETVHPILIYADLISSGYQRNIETAQVIYEKFIDRYIRED